MAVSSYQNSFNSLYPASTTGSTSWSTNGARCNICHSSGSGTDLNEYGRAFRDQRNAGLGTTAAFQAIEALNSDQSSVNNIGEIGANAQPGWRPGPNNSLYDPFGAPGDSPTQTGVNPPGTLVGAIDPVSDTTPPTVTARTPAPGATAVGTATAVTATFSESLDPATVNTSTFVLRDQLSNIVTATVTYNVATNTATLTPSSPLSNLAQYTATIVGGASGVKDQAGNALAVNSAWSFTTAGAIDTTLPTIVSRAPAPGAVGVATNTVVTATFSEALNPATVTPSTFVLRDAGNTVVPAAVSYNAGTSTATLTPSSGLASSATYTATVVGGASGVRDAAGNALAVNSTWSFTTVAVIDTTPPTVTSRVPAPGATGVATSTAVSATFSEALNATTVTPSTFELRDAGNAVVPATVSYNAGSNTATLTPSSALAFSATYTATVVGGASGVKDVAGNALAVSSTWTFTTETAPGVQFSPGTLNFFEPGLPIGSRSAARTVTVTNIGGSATAISAITVGGPGGSDFARTHNCPNPLGPGASCTVTVTFTPSTAGVRVGEIAFTTNPSTTGRIGLIGNRNAGAFVDPNGDGRGDILWRHSTAGHVVEWLMDGTTLRGGALINTVDPGWQIAGSGDFNGDGKSDVLWRHTSAGHVVVWLLDGSSIQSGVLVNTVDPSWQIGGTGDFDGDGKADILWRHTTAGYVVVWLMNGGAIKSGSTVTVPPDVSCVVPRDDDDEDDDDDNRGRCPTGQAPSIQLDVDVQNLNWVIERVADLNGDGKGDLVWRHRDTGATLVWIMDGSAIQSEALVNVVDPGWQIAGTGDFNGDGRGDLLWRHRSAGHVVVWLMDGGTIQSGALVSTVADLSWVIEGTGDFNADGKSDILWRHTLSGANQVWLMNGAAVAEAGNLGTVDTGWVVAP